MLPDSHLRSLGSSPSHGSLIFAATTIIIMSNKSNKNNNNLMVVITRMPFSRRQPPACFELVDCCDLDLDPLTFISEADLDMRVTYLYAIN